MATATAKFPSGGSKPTSENVADALGSIWPGEAQAVDLQEDGTFQIAIPASLAATFADPDGPQGALYYAMVGKREMSILVRP